MNQRRIGTMAISLLAAVALMGSVAVALTRDAEATSPSSRSGSTHPHGRGPVLLFADADGGPTNGGPDGAGAPVSLYGSGFGAERGRSTVTIGGVEVARYLEWGDANAANPALGRIVIQPGSAVTGGDIVVTVDGAVSNPLPFTVHPGNVYAISPTGSDDDGCTLAEPCASVQRASALLRGGDTVLVRGGTYHESEVWLRDETGRSGTADRRNRIVAYPGERPVFDDASRPFIIDADHVTVASIDFRNGKSVGNGSNERGRTGNWILDNTFVGDIGYEATGSHGDDHILAGNVCAVAGSTQGTQGHCYYISFGDGVRVSFNVGGGAPGYGIHVFDQRRAADDPRRTITNLTIEGNLLTGSTRRAGLILAMGDEDGRGNEVSGVRVLNNVFAGNNQLGMVVGENVHDVEIVNNTFHENGNAGLYLGAGTAGITVRANLFHQSANAVCSVECTWYPLAHVIVTPGATAELTGNHYAPTTAVLVGATDPDATTGAVSYDPALRPLAGSTNIDRVPAPLATARDANGVSRPQGEGADAGAFESVA